MLSIKQKSEDDNKLIGCDVGNNNITINFSGKLFLLIIYLFILFFIKYLLFFRMQYLRGFPQHS